MNSGETGFGFGVGMAFSLVGVVVLCCALWGCPQYSVYQQRLEGEAELAKAEYSKKVQIADAEGKAAAAQRLADAEVTRAGGVAKANQIIGNSLKDNEAYLKYLWITDVTNSKTPAVIYVPTEGNIPILEAGKAPRP